MTGYQHRRPLMPEAMMAQELARQRERADVAESQLGHVQHQLTQAQRRAAWYAKREKATKDAVALTAASEINKATERVRTLEAEAAVHVREIQRLKAMYEPDGMPRRPVDQRMGRARLEAAAAEAEESRTKGRKVA